jgi:hypothetical protein
VRRIASLRADDTLEAGLELGNGLSQTPPEAQALMLTCLLAVGWSMTNVILQYIAMQENAGRHRPGFASKSYCKKRAGKTKHADVFNLAFLN